MSRIEKTFADLKRPALVTFITAGDPDYERSLAILKSLPAAGADIIELGMPFTDPVADGPIIQAAGLRALGSGATMERTLSMAKAFRNENNTTPLVLMGYANPVYAYGIEKFVRDAAASGIDGLIIVDLPPEEDEELRGALKTHNLDLIRLITPTTDEKRLPVILKNAGGFLYYVSVTGITGAAKASPEGLKPKIAAIKKQTNLPVVIGFGIKNASDIKSIANIGQGVVVGSSIVQAIADNQNNPNLTDKIKALVSELASR